MSFGLGASRPETGANFRPSHLPVATMWLKHLATAVSPLRVGDIKEFFVFADNNYSKR
jgi:hypothetical protein